MDDKTSSSVTEASIEKLKREIEALNVMLEWHEKEKKLIIQEKEAEIREAVGKVRAQYMRFIAAILSIPEGKIAIQKVNERCD